MVESEWVSVSEAVRLSGLSTRSLKRICKEGRLKFFKSPGGHVRIRRTDLDGLLRHSQSAPVAASSVLQNRREAVESKVLEVQEARAERDLQKIREESAAVQRDSSERINAQRLVLETRREEVALQRDRDRREQEREEAQRARGKWLQSWLVGARKEFPEWIASEQEQTLFAELETELGRWDVGDDQDSIGEALDRVIKRVVAPWRVARETTDRRQGLIERIPWGLPRGATDAEKSSAIAVARSALAGLPLSASQVEEQTVINAAVGPVKQAAQRRLDEERAQAKAQADERTRAWRDEWSRKEGESKKAGLVQSGVTAASLYLFDVRENGRPVVFDDDEEFCDIKADVESAVKETLEGELTGNEDTETVRKRARHIARGKLNECCYDDE